MKFDRGDSEGVTRLPQNNSRSNQIRVFLLLMFLFALCPALFGVQLLDFKSPLHQPLFVSARQILAEDFDTDGKPDLAILGSTNVAIFSNAGNGNFTLLSNYFIGAQAPFSQRLGTLADFDGDGTNDLILENRAVLLNQGGNSFSVGTNDYGTTMSVGWGDFNGDDKLDFIYNGVTNKVVLRLPSGEFQESAELPSRYDISYLTFDFNGDGITDIKPTIGPICLFDGNGQYQTVTNGLDAFTTHITGDFNEDGILDLVTSGYSYAPPELHIYFGDGTGHFLFVTNYSVPPAEQSADFEVSHGDFDGDGHLDLLWKRYFYDSSFVWLGNGDGTFQQPVQKAFDLHLPHITGDLDGDSHSDLVMVSEHVYPTTKQIVLSSYLWSARGFQGLLPQEARLLSAGDLNGDHSDDAVVLIDRPERPVVNSLYAHGEVWLTSANAHFTPERIPSDISVHYSGWPLADFNKDGKSDLCLNHRLLLGTNSSFTEAKSWSNYIWHVSLADFNRDGRVDMVADRFGAERSGLALNQNDATFPAFTRFSTNAWVTETGDFNGDLKPDIATRGARELKVYFGNGDGTFVSPKIYSLAGPDDYDAFLCTGDFDRDGCSDIAVQDRSGALSIRIFWGSREGDFSQSKVFTPSGDRAAGLKDFATYYIVRRPQVADLNGDGKPDLAFEPIYTNAVPKRAFVTLLSRGNRTFTAQFFNTGYCMIGDYDGDDKPDLMSESGILWNNTPFSSRIDVLWRRSDGQLATWFFRGTNFITSTTVRNGIRVPEEWSFSGCIDLDGDSEKDFVWHNVDGRLAAWRMSGTNFLEALPLRSGPTAASGWRIAGFGDFNSDQKPDFLWQHSTGNISVWFMNGTNFLGTANLRKPSTGWRTVAVEDFDGDDDADILWQHPSGIVAVWLMNQTQFATSVPLRNGKPVETGWTAITAQDFSDDGHPDILFQHSSGRLAAWLMDGTNFLGAVPLHNARADLSSWTLLGTK